MVENYRTVAIIHGRPAPHPIHTKYAKSVGAEFHLVDFKMRWHDITVPAYKRYLSWLICALLFPNRNRYKVFMTEGMHFPPAIMKWFGLLNRKKQKIVGLISDEGLYFIYSGFYSRTTQKAMLQLLKSYDALICVSQMQSELADKLIGRSEFPKIYSVYNGVSDQRMKTLGQVKPDLESGNIVFIANGPSDWRGWYKGIDLLLSAFELASDKVDGLTLKIIGNWVPEFILLEIEKYCPTSKNKVEYVGPTKNLEEYLNNASLYLHCGRGEAFGISVIEAMAAAVPAIVSEWTGAKEAVLKVDEKLVVPLDASQIAQKVIWYMQLPMAEKDKLSEKSREVVQEYTEDKAIKHFQNVFQEMEKDLGINN